MEGAKGSSGSVRPGLSYQEVLANACVCLDELSLSIRDFGRRKDGGELRWNTCQKLLRIVERLGKEFSMTYGPTKIEFDEESSVGKPQQFSPIRLLDSGICAEFTRAVADQFLIEVMGTREEKRMLKTFLTEEVLEKELLEETLKVYEDVPELLHAILIVSGYLRRGVLTLGLGKRWRVEYGVDQVKCFRRMAVPFRAKDVAAEKTEFGHVDLAIVLTHLSYYYSGLSDSELFETFRVLEEKKGAEAIYSSWINSVPESDVEEDLTTYQGLNLKDTFQRRKLFELMRKHKLVIDFWLSNLVFPREAKQFPAKLVMTAWDLVYEKRAHPVTGFSGTNDSSVLLPLPISQQDLPALLETNAERERILLREENGEGHQGLEMGAMSENILKRLKQDGLKVLIDAGALMLDCDNEQVASKWLEVDGELEAVVYFSSENELMVRGRPVQGQRGCRDIPLEVSSFQERLGQCGVYLDDQHTRGTDLKFPFGTKACVTVGSKMKKDKLIQACWRMRQLGRGHSLTFYLSHEAHTKINGRQEEITTQQVLEWVEENTRAFNEDGLLYWALAGRNYDQRLAADENFYLQNGIESKASILGLHCVDEEVTSLMELYGQHSIIDLLTRVIPIWFNSSMAKLKVKNDNQELLPEIRENFERIRDAVVARCQQYVPDKTHHAWANTEEEQEKEIEVEEEQEIERPPRTSPATPYLHPNVKAVILQGHPVTITGGIMRVCDIFKDTTFWEEVQPEGWGDEVFATNDFITVIVLQAYSKTDLFLRPIEYFVTVKTTAGAGGIQVLLLSPHEVNELMPRFRSGTVAPACRLHMFSVRRSEGQDFLLNKPRLMMPRGMTPTVIPDETRTIAALLLASGSFYFRNMDEQRAFVQFLGLSPLPWTEDEEEAFRQGLIKKTGFVVPQYRAQRNKSGGVEGFAADPTWLVRQILMSRHPVLSEVAHVVRLLDEKAWVPM